MIKKTDNNRRVIKEFLEKLSEDDFIEKIIIPIYVKNGYRHYRTNTHGPGEHGKDVIFYKEVPLFYDQEYVIVQAKSEQATAQNVVHFANQLLRALKVPFPAKSGSEHKETNYVVFMNSKTHTNDANFEFPYLSDRKSNIKILSQENVIDIILTSDFVPDDIDKLIEKEEAEVLDDTYDQEIRDVLLSKDSEAIDQLFNLKLQIDTRVASPPVKEMVVNYIFHMWNENRT